VLHTIVTAADIQDRDGEAWLLGHAVRSLSLPAEALRRGWLSRILVPRRHAVRTATGAGGDRQALAPGQRLRHVAQALDDETSPCLADRCHRLGKDCENLNHKAQALLLMTSVRLRVRKLCRA
jgi:hypothetical protein